MRAAAARADRDSHPRQGPTATDYFRGNPISNDLKILTVIPAREGSRGLPGKNRQQLGGVTLVARAMQQEKRALAVDRLVVSTDDRAIALQAERAGVEVIDRPAELATDEAHIVDVLHHAIAATGGGWDAVCLLQPTSPLRSAYDIDCAIALLEGPVDSVISVTDVRGAHPGRTAAIRGGYLSPMGFARRQDLEPHYVRNGAIYVVRDEVLTEHRMHGDRCKPYLMPLDRSVNIDDRADLLWAEFLLQRKGRIRRCGS